MDPTARRSAAASAPERLAHGRRPLRIGVHGLGFLMLIIVAACVGSAGDAMPPDPGAAVTHTVTPSMLARGRKIYLRDCAPCHGREGKGDGPSAAVLDPKPRDHSDGTHMDKLTDQRIADTVSMGGVIGGYPNMPSIPHISGDDMVALIAYFRTLGHAEGVETVTIFGRPAPGRSGSRH